MMIEKATKVIIRGGGDLASGIARRVHLAGLNVVVLELKSPRAIRRTVSYASAVHDGEITIERVRGVRCTEPPGQRRDFIPVLIDEQCRTIGKWNPDIIIDARMRKKNPEKINLPGNRFVLGIGPDFEVGENCHAIVETNRGHSLGRVLWRGKASKNTRVPGSVCGYTTERVLRSPVKGDFNPFFTIGDPVTAGDKIASVGRNSIHAEIDGILRGVLYPGTFVSKGQKVGDIDPRENGHSCFTVSDKANAIAGGAMEAVLTWINSLSSEI
ncbi:MAG: EF2563 family selenium-dependent molybdenum hydroxylase system protein [bacterium]|nr:EF2563 family selenium-dependent molybdenum hydroxylase system protein [bacterium]